MSKKKYGLFVIDLDGTMYRGNEPISEAAPFIEHVIKEKQDFIFLTNNSTKTPADVVQHLQQFQIPAREDQVYTSSTAAADYITQSHTRPRVYMIGEKGLKLALEAAGCQLIEREEELHRSDYVVMGLDRQITYEKLAKAAIAVRSGAVLISTNADKALPTERGLLPGNGSLTSVISTATQTEPIFIGKPEPIMINMILEERGIDRSEVLMIGDNYETDILTGIHAGIDTAIVFTGYTSPEDLGKREEQPTYQWQHLLEWKQDIDES